MAQEYVSLAPLINWRGQARPLDWAGCFGRQAPLEVDLGCGNGQRLVQRAMEHPELNLVGLDLNWGSIRRALHKVAVAGVSNVRLVQVRAQPGLKLLFTPGQISRADALFPMPWPADRDEPKRLLKRGFLRLANSRLCEGGSLRMVTDQREYWLWATEQAKGAGFRVQVRTRKAGLGTKYERKWHEQGQSLFYELNLSKREANPLPVWEDEVLRPYRISRMNPRAFPVQNFPGDIFIGFIDILFDEARGRAMLRCVVEEEGFNQPFWLEFVRRESDWEMRPAPNCPLVPTKGVQKAMELAARLAGDTWKKTEFTLTAQPDQDAGSPETSAPEPAEAPGDEADKPSRPSAGSLFAHQE